MPEGDSIYRAAQALHRALAGKTVTSFETVLPKLARVDDDAPVTGRTIERVTSAGKNLIIEFSGDLHLHTHMKMNGSWHIYRPGERWKRPRRDMRIVIGTDELRRRRLHGSRGRVSHQPQPRARRPISAAWAPTSSAQPSIATKRCAGFVRVRTKRSRTFCSISASSPASATSGNRRSLFCAGVDPFHHVSDLDDAQLERIVDCA